MIKTKIIFLILFLFSFQNIDTNQRIIDEVKLKYEEKVIIIYQNISGCLKCMATPMNIIYQSIKKSKNKKIKLIALVYCRRDIELTLFKRNYNWEDYLLRVDHNVKDDLGVSESSIISVMNSYGEIILNIEPSSNSNDNIEKLTNILNY